MRYLIQGGQISSQQDINDLCASFQYTIGRVLKNKCIYAVKMFDAIKANSYPVTFVLSGGVASNTYLRNL